MGINVSYIGWDPGVGYTNKSASISPGYGSTTPIYALSGSVVVTFNDVDGTVTETATVYHTPTSSYTFTINKNSTNIFTDAFTISKAAPVHNINQATSLVSANINDKIYFQLLRNDIDYSGSIGDLIRVSRNDNGLAYLLNTNELVSITASLGPFITYASNTTLCLTSSFYNFYNNSSSFYPTSSTLYGQFGDVYNDFNILPYDVLITKNPDGIKQYNILSVDLDSSGSLCIELDVALTSETAANLEYILILKRIEDETNVILNYNKSRGEVSYGFIIPNNIHPDIMNNIDIITKEVKTKLLEINNN